MLRCRGAGPRTTNINEAGVATVMLANTGASRGTGGTAATAGRFTPRSSTKGSEPSEHDMGP